MCALNIGVVFAGGYMIKNDYGGGGRVISPVLLFPDGMCAVLSTVWRRKAFLIPFIY